MKKRRSNTHGVVVSPKDWELWKELAANAKVTPAALANIALGLYAKAHGQEWEGLKERGRPEKQSNKGKQEVKGDE